MVWQASGLEPGIVWKHFETLCRIPRASHQEGALREHLLQWAGQQGLEASVDGAGNLIVRKGASPGFEKSPGVVLQAHLDMVCQANSGYSHNFSRDPIRPLAKDGWLMAEHTTLGADNGIGVALILAALEDRRLAHGPLEALFTVVEESGMDGAQNLVPGLLAGQYLLNLDTEEWGEIYLGCAGGLDVNVTRPGVPEAVPGNLLARCIALSGLKGGHSGVDIHRGRGNAIKLMVRLLRTLEARIPFRLASLEGGTARNALPREAFATILIEPADMAALDEAVAECQAGFRRELAGADDGLVLECSSAIAEALMSLDEQAIWLGSLHAAPHGVKRMSLAMPGVVETSNNLGVVAIHPDGGNCNFMVRSLLDTAAEAQADEIVSLFSLSHTDATKTGHYPGWTPNPDSPLLKRCLSTYQREFGTEARTQVIHAGLECGIIGAKYPELDMVSFGPTIHGAHAPGEAVEIASVGRCWELLKAVLADLCA